MSRRRYPVWNVCGTVVGYKPSLAEAAAATRAIGGCAPDVPALTLGRALRRRAGGR